MKVGGLLLLKTMADAKSSVITTTYPADLNKVDQNQESLKYSANTNFKVCSCDMSTDSCDPFCCCDSSCSEAVINEWTANNRCANINYEKSPGKIFSPCMNRQDQYNFNKQNGLHKYVDPLSRLLCVTLDNSPEMGNYYQQLTESTLENKLSEVKLNATSQRHTQGFVATSFIPDVQTPGDKTYKIGDKMKSLVVTDTQILKEQYQDGFPFPKADAFGVCSSYNSAHFMMDDQSSCLQMANL